MPTLTARTSWATFRARRCFVIDYKLPEMNGLDVLAELRRRRIDAPTILITTHPSAAVRQRTADTRTVLIEKPLLGEMLFHEICEAIGNKTGKM